MCDHEVCLEELMKFRDSVEYIFYREDVSDEKKELDKLIKKVKKGKIDECIKSKEE